MGAVEVDGMYPSASFKGKISIELVLEDSEIRLCGISRGSEFLTGGKSEKDQDKLGGWQRTEQSRLATVSTSGNRWCCKRHLPK